MIYYGANTDSDKSFQMFFKKKKVFDSGLHVPYLIQAIKRPLTNFFAPDFVLQTFFFIFWCWILFQTVTPS